MRSLGLKWTMTLLALATIGLSCAPSSREVSTGELQATSSSGQRTASVPGVPEHEIGIQVMDHEAWKPMAGVKVFYITDAEYKERKEELTGFEPRSPWDDQSFQTLRHVTTDHNGQVVLKLSGTVVRLYAHQDGYRGTKRVVLGDHPRAEVDFMTTLFLEPYMVYEVRVVRANGDYVPGVEVAFQRTRGSGSVTNTFGKAYLGLPLSQWSEAISYRNGEIELPVTCKLPLLEVQEHAFPANENERKMKLRLPEFGGVRVLSPDGIGDQKLYLRTETNGAIPWVPMKLEEWQDQPCWHYGFVPLNSRIEVKIGTKSKDHSGVQRYIRSASGPTRDGQWITLKSDDANTQQITGKCLDGRGSPLADSFLTLWPLTADGRLIGKQLHGRSGENGEFTFYLHPDDFDFDQIELLWIDRDPDQSPGLPWDEHQYLVQSVALGSKTILDLGDLEPEALVTLVRGKVFFENGSVIPNARIRVERFAGSNFDQSSANNVRPARGPVANKRDKDEFAVLIVPAPFDCSYLLSVDMGNDRFVHRQIVQPGTKNLEVVLSSKKEVHFSCQTVAVKGRWQFDLVDAAGISYRAEDIYDQQSFYPPPGERLFRSKFHAPAGEYTFRATSLGEGGGEVVEIPNVVIVSAEHLPADLQKINLLQDSLITIELVNPNWQFKSDYDFYDVAVLEKTADGYRKTQKFEKKRRKIHLPMGLLNTGHVLIAEGFQPLPLDGLVDGQVVDMVAQPKVQFDLQPEVGPWKGIRAWAEFSWLEGETGLWLHSDHDRQLAIGVQYFSGIPIPAYGRYKLTWRLRRIESMTVIAEFDGGEIQLTESSEPIPLAIPIEVLQKVEALAEGD